MARDSPKVVARLAMPVVASLSLGLAPFAPEPHIVGKLRWVFGGAAGMGPMDWFDLAFHGAPWLWLLVSLVLVLRPRPKGPDPASDRETDEG